MVVSSLPSALCGFVMLFLFPESPKFTFSNGDEEKTLKILDQIHRWNTGKKFSIKSLAKDEEFQDISERKPMNLVHSMWSQTAPLFKHPHLRNILTVCFIQFSIFNTCNGFHTFFMEITNRIALWMESDPSHKTATVCDIFRETQNVFNPNTTSDVVCISKLQPEVFENTFYFSFIHLFGWTILALIINRIGKLVILASLSFVCGLCGFSLIFINLPVISGYVYVGLLVEGLAITILGAATVELFPTKFRFV